MSAATDGWPEQDTAEGHGSAATPREPTDAPMRTGDEQEAVTAEGHALGEVVGDDDARSLDDAAYRALLRQHVQAALATLPERERVVLQLRFGLAGHHPHTLGEIGGRLGLTRERTRQIESAALRRLRATELSAEVDHPDDVAWQSAGRSSLQHP